MKTRFLFAAILSTATWLGASAASAAPVTMDFNALGGSGLVSRGYSYTEDGFRLSSDGNHGLFSIQAGDHRYSGSTSMFNNGAGATTTLSKIGGGAFALDSIDLDSLNGAYNVTVRFMANLLGGGTAVQSFTTDAAFASLQTFSFSSAFSSVTSVSWVQASPFHSFDNIRLDQGSGNQVPEPGTLALLSIAMLGLVAGRRRLGK